MYNVWSYIWSTFLLLLFGVNAYAQVEIIPEGGNHVDLSEVEVKIPDGFSVYYTKDGSVPSKSSIKITSPSLKLNSNSVFRFAIYDEKNKRSEVVHSYFTERKHDMGIISLVTEPAHFFDSVSGIYVKGCCADTVPPYKGANFWKKMEKPVHVEFIETDGQRVISQDAGVRIFGGYSKGNPQKSLALFARKKYGDNRFRHPFFSDLPLKKYKNIVLRNAGGDMFGAHIRDVYASQLVKHTGLTIQEYRPVAVYINGAYWGKYNLREKINEHFIKAHYGYPKDSLIIMRHNADSQHGPPSSYRKFIKKLDRLDLSKDENVQYVASQIDIDNYFLYNISEVYTGNGDAGGNIRYYRSMHDTAKWRWIFYDLDQGMNINSKNEYNINTLEKFTTYSDELWPNPAWSTFIIRKLLENDSLKEVYINRYCDLLNTTFEKNRATELVNKLYKEVEQESVYHKKRWNIRDKRYDTSWDYLKIFAELRPAAMMEHIQQRFELENPIHVIVIVDGNHGRVKWNSLTISKDFAGNYFSDVNVKLEAIPRFDYEFKGWKNVSYSREAYVQLPKRDTVVLEPIFERRKKSKYFGNVMFSEISASQSEGINSGDWIELYSASQGIIDVSGWMLLDDKDDHKFVFPEGSIIYPDSFLVVAQNLNDFISVYGKDYNVVGSFEFGIDSKKDVIRLYDRDTNWIENIDITELIPLEDDTSTWSKMDYRISHFHAVNWKLEQPTPGKKSKANIQLLNYEKKEKWIKGLFFYVGISIIVATLFVFFFILRKEKVKNTTKQS